MSYNTKLISSFVNSAYPPYIWGSASPQNMHKSQPLPHNLQIGLEMHLTGLTLAILTQRTNFPMKLIWSFSQWNLVAFSSASVTVGCVGAPQNYALSHGDVREFRKQSILRNPAARPVFPLWANTCHRGNRHKQSQITVMAKAGIVVITINFSVDFGAARHRQNGDWARDSQHGAKVLEKWKPVCVVLTSALKNMGI